MMASKANVNLPQNQQLSHNKKKLRRRQELDRACCAAETLQRRREQIAKRRVRVTELGRQLLK